MKARKVAANHLRLRWPFVILPICGQVVISHLGRIRKRHRYSRRASPSPKIRNGGAIENTGQLWFGADDEHSPDTRVSFTINDGSLDLTGGTIPLSNSTLVVDADLALFYDYSEALGRPKNEEYEINFTGPGSITVDSAGINVYRQDEFSIWTGGDPVAYEEDLWNQGIRKANGVSGATTTPGNFSDFFTVSGTPGMDDYTLTSLIEAVVPPGVPGDYNGNGTVDAADYVLWRKGGTLQNEVADPGVNSADDYTEWRARFGNTAGSGAALPSAQSLSAAVPEPSTAVLLTAGALGLLAGARRRTGITRA